MVSVPDIGPNRRGVKVTVTSKFPLMGMTRGKVGVTTLKSRKLDEIASTVKLAVLPRL